MVQQREPGMRFLVVGRNPSREVVRLSRRPGVTVTGTVPDVRPYVAGARAVVVPLRIARGVQNKVLEALAMGKVVLATPEVCRTFGQLPVGLVRCDSPSGFVEAVCAGSESLPAPEEIRAAACRRFSWERSLGRITDALRSVVRQPGARSGP